MTQFVQVTPFMHVPDIDAGVDFFTQLGFAAIFRSPGYAYVEREGCGVRMLERDEDEPAPPVIRGYACYFDVRDVDALYAEMRSGLDVLPEGAVLPPADKAWHQREFVVTTPDGALIAFGQPVVGA